MNTKLTWKQAMLFSTSGGIRVCLPGGNLLHILQIPSPKRKERAIYGTIIQKSLTITAVYTTKKELDDFLLENDIHGADWQNGVMYWVEDNLPCLQQQIIAKLSNFDREYHGFITPDEEDNK